VISICIPAYKHVSLTHEAALSVLNQDIDVELVVLNDFYLLDKTPENRASIEALSDYLHSDRRVKYISNDSLLPIQENWNKAVSLCSRKYIKLIGADDRLLDGSLLVIEKIIKTEPNVLFHGHLANIIDGQGSLVRRQQPYNINYTSRPFSGPTALKAKLRQQIRFKEPACNFFSKVAWEKCGGYESKFRFTFDIHFNIKMMSAFPSMLWNEYLVELRRHQQSDGAQLSASLALSDLSGLVLDILGKIDSKVNRFDRAAATGWLQYRIIELAAQRLKRNPSESFNLLVENASLLLSNPIGTYFTSKLLLNRIRTGDVQQS
jgi:glycosyltransferase involved in cell wall biosynthesis